VTTVDLNFHRSKDLNLQAFQWISLRTLEILIREAGITYSTHSRWKSGISNTMFPQPRLSLALSSLTTRSCEGSLRKTGLTRNLSSANCALTEVRYLSSSLTLSTWKKITGLSQSELNEDSDQGYCADIRTGRFNSYIEFRGGSLRRTLRRMNEEN